MTRWRGVVEEYRKFLPVTAQTPVITLGEGNTPLIRATRLAKKIAPGVDLYLKYEGVNPTGSFKDRGMTMAISKALEGGGSGSDVCFDREHLRFGSRIRRTSRARSLRADSGRKDRLG